MTEDEKTTFYFQIIEKFLIEPHSNYSQVAIMRSLNQFNIPIADLMSYTATRLEFAGKGVQKQDFFKQLIAKEQTNANPVTLLAVMLSLSQVPLQSALESY